MEATHQSIFRAYDIRGVYPNEINEQIVNRLMPVILKRLIANAHKKTIVVIGRDARLSSPALCDAAREQIKNYFAEKQVVIHEPGLITTPMLYFLCQKLKADAGIMITASHNPKEFNGIKMIDRNGYPVGGDEIKTLAQ